MTPPSIICSGSGPITIAPWTSQTPQDWVGEKGSSGVWGVSGPEPEPARHPVRQHNPSQACQPPLTLACRRSWGNWRRRPWPTQARRLLGSNAAVRGNLKPTAIPPAVRMASTPPVHVASLPVAAPSKPEPAPRQHPPVPAPRRRYAVRASPGPVPPVSALPEHPQVPDRAPTFPKEILGGLQPNPLIRHGRPSSLIRHGHPSSLIHHGHPSPLNCHGRPSSPPPRWMLLRRVPRLPGGGSNVSPVFPFLSCHI